MDGFHQHIKEAISKNKERKRIYAALTQNRSKPLSNLLIGLEYLTLPIAKHYDRRGKSFNERGIMIVKNDFVPMDINPSDHPVRYRKKLGKAVLQIVKTDTADAIRNLPKQMKTAADLELVYDYCHEWFRRIEAMEERHEVHLAMLKHVVESVAFIAKNGGGYAVQSEGESVALSASMVKVHGFALRNALWLDGMANEFHLEGVGVLVNDMPGILG